MGFETPSKHVKPLHHFDFWDFRALETGMFGLARSRETKPETRDAAERVIDRPPATPLVWICGLLDVSVPHVESTHAMCRRNQTRKDRLIYRHCHS